VYAVRPKSFLPISGDEGSKGEPFLEPASLVGLRFVLKKYLKESATHGGSNFLFLLVTKLASPRQPALSIPPRDSGRVWARALPNCCKGSAS